MKYAQVITLFVSTANAHCPSGVENDLMRIRKSIDFVGMPMITCGSSYDGYEYKNDQSLVGVAFPSQGTGTSCLRGSTSVEITDGDYSLPNFDSSRFCQNYVGETRLNEYQKELRYQSRARSMPLQSDLFIDPPSLSQMSAFHRQQEVLRRPENLRTFVDSFYDPIEKKNVFRGGGCAHIHVLENDMPKMFWQGARKHESLQVCMTKTGKEFIKRTGGQPFSYFDFLNFVIENGDFKLYDRHVKTYEPETQITNAESYIDWLAVRNPKIAETIRLKNVESFGNMEGHHEAEPTVFQEQYCPKSRGNARLGDCCNSEEKNSGCLKDSGLRCALQKVYDEDQQRILLAKGERCIKDDDCGDELKEKEGGGYYECLATSVKTVFIGAFATTMALLEL